MRRLLLTLAALLCAVGSSLGAQTRPGENCTDCTQFTSSTGQTVYSCASSGKYWTCSRECSGNICTCVKSGTCSQSAFNTLDLRLDGTGALSTTSPGATAPARTLFATVVERRNSSPLYSRGCGGVIVARHYSLSEAQRIRTATASLEL
jgi:hypothetical protein